MRRITTYRRSSGAQSEVWNADDTVAHNKWYTSLVLAERAAAQYR
jgi:hypothetical protein